jgi:hypothetical protein
MYNVELMMAIIVASTALVGLTGIIVGQIRGRRKLSIKWRRKIRNNLIASFGLGMAASLFGVLWLLVPVEPWRSIAVFAFIFQVLCVVPTALAFWSVD